MATIEQLAYADDFVRTLPGDPRTDNTLRQVHNACYSRVAPTAVAKPELLALIPEVCALLDLSPEPTPGLVEVLAGNRVVPGMAPYAACYGGHQFGAWAGQLGDGRAITLGEVRNTRGEVWEMQLKGAGPTPYSRRADGRAVLRSSLRELVCSEAMHHLGVPTTRALSLVLTGDGVERDILYNGNARIEPGAVVCRVAPTFLRFGNYELPTSRDDLATLERLVAFTLERYFPHCKGDVVAMFDEVMRRTAFLITEWLRVGFVHGVMNTDNMSILGLTIDYGPYGWVEPFDLDWTPNITDASGRRYRFGNQPAIAQWNLAQLARSLAPLLGDPAPLARSLDEYPAVLRSLHRHTTLRKLGLTGRADTYADDSALLAELEAILVAHPTDMTIFYRALADGDPADAFYGEPTREHAVRVALFRRSLALRARIEDSAPDERVARMHAINPIYVPRNYLLQEVIEATEAGDRTELPALLDVLRRPYTQQAGAERYAAKRPAWAEHKPGCSMLSCSS